MYLRVTYSIVRLFSHIKA